MQTCSLCHPHQPQKPGQHGSENQTTDFSTTPQWVCFTHSHSLTNSHIWSVSSWGFVALTFQHLYVVCCWFIFNKIGLSCVLVSSQSQTNWESGSAGSVWVTMRLCTMTRTNYGKHVRKYINTHTHFISAVIQIPNFLSIELFNGAA